MGITIAIIVGCILAAAVFFLFEFLTPTFGPLFAMGVLSLCGAVWATYTISGTAAMVVGVALVPLTGLYIAFLIRVMPNTRAGKRLFLDKVPNAAASGSPAAGELVGLIGKSGVAETTLRPGGAVRVEGKRIHARAETGIIEKDRPVIIVSASGNEVIVRQVE
jgi:membrane-bound serine protease (ClpP class)